MWEGIRKRLQRTRPGLVVVISYLGVAVIGTALLMLPIASTGLPLPVIDALFTATSAICVTGLIVVDTGTQFTLFGKTVILSLIQLGGLGVMTFSVLLFVFIGRGIGLKQRWIINEGFSATPIPDVGHLISAIFYFTFIVEGAGAVLLFLFWRSEMPAAPAAFSAVFHSVSAFCNAGFSLFRTSFIQYRGSVLLNATICLLIVIGGLGFPVIYEFIRRAQYRRAHIRIHLSLHTKMVIWMTLVLIVAGFAAIFLLERGHGPLIPWHEKIATSLFQSITARTAGFNTLDIPALSAATLFVLIMLMFIGASPGSCGGGIKTTSLAVMAAILKNKISGRDTVSIFHRTLPDETVSRALSIFILAVITITLGLILLLVTESSYLDNGTFSFQAYLFEAVSAFATVGLSMGVTSSLTAGGKVVIIILMLLGRVGLLTVAYVVTRKIWGRHYRYSEEKVMIG